jgi:hypothetical protein
MFKIRSENLHLSIPLSPSGDEHVDHTAAALPVLVHVTWLDRHTLTVRLVEPFGLSGLDVLAKDGPALLSDDHTRLSEAGRAAVVQTLATALAQLRHLLPECRALAEAHTARGRQRWGHQIARNHLGREARAARLEVDKAVAAERLSLAVAESRRARIDAHLSAQRARFPDALPDPAHARVVALTGRAPVPGLLNCLVHLARHGTAAQVARHLDVAAL